MSLKKFLIILGISFLIWIASTYAQGLVSIFVFKESINLLGSSDVITGYPIALSLREADTILALIVDSINIVFWFGVIYYILRYFKHKKRS